MIKLKNIVLWQKVIREIYFISESVRPTSSMRSTVKARLVSREQAEEWRADPSR